MIAVLSTRWRRWRTSAEWHLTRHFFRAMFDFGILTEAGSDAFKHLLVGGIGGMIAFGFLIVRILVGRYIILGMAPTPEPYRRALLGDDMLMIGLPMLLVAFVTLVVSDSLFPDERDFRILGPLPVKRSTIFATKLGGLILFTGLIVGVVHASLLPWLLLSSINRWLDHSILARIVAWVIASVSASLFAVLAITALVGMLRLTLSHGRLHAITALAKSAVFAALVLCIPLVYHVAAVTSLLLSGSMWLALVPPGWFVGLERLLVGSATPILFRLAVTSLGGLAAVSAITAIVYVVLFRRFERLVLQPTSTSKRSATVTPDLGKPVRRSATSDQSFAPPAFRAILGFISTTFRRSETHQSVLVGLSIFGLGIALNSIIGASPRSLARAPYWTPFALMFASGVAVRSTLVLPMHYRANWIFKMTEDPATRRDQFRVVDYLASICLAGVPAAWSLLVWWIATGDPSPTAAVVVGLIGLVAVHAVLFDWRRIPFTCSYLPGKRFIFYSITIAILAFAFFMAIGAALVTMSQRSPTRTVTIVIILAIAAWLLRRTRLGSWGQSPLMFEDEFPDRVLELQL
ncbi:MAG TPA: hypothetical protein VH436_30275 [Vicinamibacterales bacterium]|jgi:hypothetical protein